MKSIGITVQKLSDSYFARAGVGHAAKIASSTNAAHSAAAAAAAKFFPASHVRVTVVEGSPQHGTRFRAEATGPKGGRK